MGGSGNGGTTPLPIMASPWQQTPDRVNNQREQRLSGEGVLWIICAESQNSFLGLLQGGERCWQAFLCQQTVTCDGSEFPPLNNEGNALSNLQGPSRAFYSV